jgi:hypothetical protein
VESDLELRAAVAKHVTLLLQHPEATHVFPGTLPNGTRQVLVALPDDALGPVFRRIKSLGGTANVAVPDGDNLAVIVFSPSSGEATQTDECPVSRKSVVGVLLALLQSTGRPARCRLTEPDYEAELVDNSTHAPSIA